MLDNYRQNSDRLNAAKTEITLLLSQLDSYNAFFMEWGISLRPHSVENNRITAWFAEGKWPCEVRAPQVGDTPLEALQKCYYESEKVKAWSTECPTEPGDYLLKCMENDNKPELVVIYLCPKLNVLRCNMDFQKGNTVDAIHFNLADPQWSKC